MNGVKWW